MSASGCFVGPVVARTRLNWLAGVLSLLGTACTAALADLPQAEWQEQCRSVRFPMSAIVVTDYRRYRSMPDVPAQLVVDLKLRVDEDGEVISVEMDPKDAALVSADRLRGVRLIPGVGKPLELELRLTNQLEYPPNQRRDRFGWELSLLGDGGRFEVCASATEFAPDGFP
jgi:hypothetical protein